ncbi:MAG: PCMD domain-containing protein [Bacteroidales bacterium]
MYIKTSNKHRWLAPLLTLLILMSLMSGCIENDIPYPRTPLYITELQVRGAISSPSIDNDKRVVTLHLSDSVNPRKVYVESIKVTESAETTLSRGQLLDLTNPVEVTLSLYQDYIWSINAEQNIERRFNITGQVGQASFNTEQRIASLNLGSAFSLDEIELLDLKLGPEGSTINMSNTLPTLEWNIYGDYAHTTVMVNYSDFIVMEEWSLYVFLLESNVSTLRVDPFTQVAYLYGAGIDGANNGFEYRITGAESWTSVDASQIINQGEKFYTRLTGLTPETSYQARAVTDSEQANTISFTTGRQVTLVEGVLDNWHKVGSVWNPWSETSSSFWDTGNKGASTLGESNTTPTEETSTGSGKAAKLESKFVGIGTIGKFAAGNLFVGEFKRVDGTNGVLDFGRPFTEKPTRLEGSYRYSSKPINYYDKELFPHLANVPDTCAIYIALGDWDSPVEIRTKASERKLFDPNDSNIIAYAELFTGESMDNYEPFTLELEYRDTERTPKYLIIVCSASRYGDYFTGGAGSTLLIDNLELGWD